MLGGIDPILNADIFHALRAMEHANEIVIADPSFPAVTDGKHIISMEASKLDRMLRAVLSAIPIDIDEPDPVLGMEVIGASEKLVSCMP